MSDHQAPGRAQLDERRTSRRAKSYTEDHPVIPAPHTAAAPPQSSPTSLLAATKLSSRGNAPVRVSRMTQMQQTYGNRAVQRLHATQSNTAPSPQSSALTTAGVSGNTSEQSPPVQIFTGSSELVAGNQAVQRTTGEATHLTQTGPVIRIPQIQRMATANVEERVTFMHTGLTGLLNAKAIADEWKAAIRAKYEAEVRNAFKSKTGAADNDRLYKAVIDDTKAFITAYEAGMAALTKYNAIGGDFGKKNIKDAQVALVKAMKAHEDAGAITTTAGELSTIANSDEYSSRKSLGERMGTARSKEEQYKTYAANPSPTPQETATLEALKGVIEAAKGKDAGVSGPDIEPIEPYLEKLRRFALITVFSEEVRDKYTKPPYHLPEGYARLIYDRRHKEHKSSYKTRESVEGEYKASVAQWRTTKEGNESTTVVPDATGDVSMDFAARLEKHIFKGDVNFTGQGSGVHFKSAMEDGTARIVEGSRQELTGGFYTARVEVKKGAEWKAKPERSTFFPDGWSKDNVLEQITTAWDNKVWLIGNEKWSGTVGGVEYQGYAEGGKVTAAWPHVVPE